MGCSFLDWLELPSLAGSLSRYIIAVVKPRGNGCQDQDKDSPQEDGAAPIHQPETTETPALLDTSLSPEEIQDYS